jgi:hypothetical protein
VRLRIALVRGFARLLGIPIDVYEHEVIEVRMQHIRDYLFECDEIAEKVFDMPEEARIEMVRRGYKFMCENIDNPFIMHDEPLIWVGHWLGYGLGDDPRWVEASRKWQTIKRRESGSSRT